MTKALVEQALVEQALARLESLLNEKDEQIKRLNEHVEKLEDRLRGTEYGWMFPVQLDSSQTLPVPRLELIYTSLSKRKGSEWSWYEVIYRLVYCSYQGTVVARPFGKVEVSGRIESVPPIKDGRLRLPLDVGAHICHDMEVFRLPGFAICGEHVDDLTDLAGHPERR